MRRGMEPKSGGFTCNPSHSTDPDSMAGTGGAQAQERSNRGHTLRFGRVRDNGNARRPEKVIVQTAWENNANFSRTSQTILSFAAQLGLTEEQIDQLFITGAKLVL